MPTRQVDTTRDDALGTSDLTDMIERLGRREVSAAELREAAVQRAHDANLRLNAVVTWVDHDVTGDAGRVGDGPFAGVPTLIKDNEDLAGYPTLEGSWAVPDRVKSEHTPWVEQFLALGVRPIAKTTLPEFGLTASTESSRFGATRNPWNVHHSVGGSSGGSAALVAAGVVPIAHANDGGGSIRIPAAACGVVGLKPTRGRLVDRPDLERLPINLVTQGVVTRSVRDTARYLAEAERLRPAPNLPPVGHVTGPEPRRLRIGVLTESVRGLPLDPATIDVVDRAATLCEGLGHHVESVAVPVNDQFATDFLRYWAFIAFMLKRTGRRMYGEGFDGSRVEEFTRGLSWMFTREAERLPLSLRRLRALARDGESVFPAFDVLLSPVLGHPAPPIGFLGPEVEFRTHLIRLLRFTTFTPVQNVTGSPAISLPLGMSADGMPIGVQAAAPAGHEARLLSLALEIEGATNGFSQPV